MTDVFEVLIENRAAYLSGLVVTLQICAVAWILGLLGGTFAALLAHWQPKLIGLPLSATSRISEAVPVLVLLFWLHYPAQSALGVVVDPFYTTSLLLAILNSLAVYGIIVRAIMQVPKDLIEAATVCGIPSVQTFWRIKLPLALRASLGSLFTAQINVLQLSIFGGLIAVEELFRVSQQINSQVYQPVNVYSILGLFFLFGCLPMNLFAQQLEKRFK